MSSLDCGLCGAEPVTLKDFYLVTIGGGRGGGHGGMWLCGSCLSRPVADVLAAADRQREAEAFAEQAEKETEELTRDPRYCKERIQVTGYGHYGEYRYCSRDAKHDDGLCTQHHKAAEDARRFRERYPHGLKSD